MKYAATAAHEIFLREHEMPLCGMKWNKSLMRRSAFHSFSYFTASAISQISRDLFHWKSLLRFNRDFLVEVRGIEPLSEDSDRWFSPSGASHLNFAWLAAGRQAAYFAILILPESPQRFDDPVPHINDAG